MFIEILDDHPVLDLSRKEEIFNDAFNEISNSSEDLFKRENLRVDLIEV